MPSFALAKNQPVVKQGLSAPAILLTHSRTPAVSKPDNPGSGTYFFWYVNSPNSFFKRVSFRNLKHQDSFLSV